MGQLMEYNIISGKVVERRRCYLPCRDGSIKTRGTRKAGSSSIKKIEANERGAVNKLGRILNTNFVNGFKFVTLKYGKERRPADYEQLKKNAGVFCRKLRAWCQKHGQEYKYVMINANWNPKRDCEARLHHHLMLPVDISTDYLEELWPADEMYIKVVHNPGDLTALAKYLIGNVHGLAAGEKKWTTSKGLDKPIYTEPKPVDDMDSIEPIPGTSVVEAAQYTDEEGFVTSSYIRAICHERIKVRGGMVILPKKRKKDKMPLTLDMAVWQDDE